MGGVINHSTVSHRQRAVGGLENVSKPDLKALGRKLAERNGEAQVRLENQVNHTSLSERKIAQDDSTLKTVRIATMVNTPPTEVMSSEDLVAIAGAPKDDSFLKKQSTTYKELLSALDACKQSEGEGAVKRLSLLLEAQGKAETYVEKKMKESPKGALDGVKNNPRLDGGIKALQSIKAGKEVAISEIAKVFAQAVSRGSSLDDLRAASALAAEIGALDVESQAALIHSMPAEVKDKALFEVAKQVADVNKSPQQAVDLLSILHDKYNESSSMIQQNLGVPLGVGELDESAMTTAYAYSSGLLDLPVLLSMIATSGQLLGGDMSQREGAQAWIDSVDQKNVQNSYAWQSVKENGVLGGVDDSDGTPEFNRKIALQSAVVTSDRLLRAAQAQGLPGLMEMVATWDQMMHRDVDEYIKERVSELPADQQAKAEKAFSKALDIDGDTFSAALANLDAGFFDQVVQKKKGAIKQHEWSRLPDQLSSIPSGEEIVNDFMARYAPGNK